MPRPRRTCAGRLRAELVRARRRARLESGIGDAICAELSQDVVDVLVGVDQALARRVVERPPASGTFTRRLVPRRLEEVRRGR